MCTPCNRYFLLNESLQIYVKPLVVLLVSAARRFFVVFRRFVRQRNRRRGIRQIVRIVGASKKRTGTNDDYKRAKKFFHFTTRYHFNKKNYRNQYLKQLLFSNFYYYRARAGATKKGFYDFRFFFSQNDFFLFRTIIPFTNHRSNDIIILKTEGF